MEEEEDGEGGERDGGFGRLGGGKMGGSGGVRCGA